MFLKTSIRQSVFDIYRLTYFFKISYVRTRVELPLVLNRQRLTGKGVEVGVWKGEFSDFILKRWKGKILYSVDPWKYFPGDEYEDDMNIQQKQFDIIYEQVNSLLGVYGNRSKRIRKTSVEASEDFKNETLDFVYLDGRHSYKGVKEDIELWFPKVRNGGLLCGHDYINEVIGNTDFGVKKAVDEFIEETSLRLIVTKKDKYPSWFAFKTL